MRQNWKGGAWQKIYYRKTDVPGFSHWSALVQADRDPDLASGKPRVKFPLNLLVALLPARLFQTEPNWLHSGFVCWLFKRLFWRKCAILYVLARPGTKFRIGFYSKGLMCKLSPVVHTVAEHPEKNGLFALRVGPEETHFFIVSDKSAKLCEHTYAYFGSKIDKKSYQQVIVY